MQFTRLGLCCIHWAQPRSQPCNAVRCSSSTSIDQRQFGQQHSKHSQGNSFKVFFLFSFLSESEREFCDLQTMRASKWNNHHLGFYVCTVYNRDYSRVTQCASPAACRFPSNNLAQQQTLAKKFFLFFSFFRFFQRVSESRCELRVDPMRTSKWNNQHLGFFMCVHWMQPRSQSWNKRELRYFCICHLCGLVVIYDL